MVAMTTPYAVPPLTPNEERLVREINATWTPERARSELVSLLQTAVEVELATIPIYLYTYYSIDRTVAKGQPGGFPSTDLARFADKAGALIMSVAVEEMLHMSLSSNIYFSLTGKPPALYLRSPAPYPSSLPGHAFLGPDGEPFEVPLAKLSVDHLWHFLEIEYPEERDAPPEDANWQTIGQIYSYIRCIIESDRIQDCDFQKGAESHQIQSTNYSPNNIDTGYPEASFDINCPTPATTEGSASEVSQFASREDSHVGPSALMPITSCEQAVQAITTICFQGEGFDHTRFDDPTDREQSHYAKFLSVQSELAGYPGADPHRIPLKIPPALRQFTPDELRAVVFDFPDNPVAAAFPEGRRDIADIASGLYQYMLIMCEAIFLQTPENQKLYFNRTLHMSMIWVLDKFIQSMRTVYLEPTGASPGQCTRLAPPFDNINLGARHQAFATLKSMCARAHARYADAPWYQQAGLDYYIDKAIPELPDVSEFFEPKPASTGCDVSQYAGVPKFPSSPPATVASGEVRHACMGLNSCRDQGRTRDNACAGQGYCSTALAYNAKDPSSPSVSDHTCHVQNDCANQGGCGLYGTAAEQLEPGHNGCQNLGSCATPINAERFASDGAMRGKSVWLRAREVFTDKVWPGLREQNPDLPEAPPPVPGSAANPDLFAYGPTIEWIQDYSDAGMTACGSSGLSGAGSCA